MKNRTISMASKIPPLSEYQNHEYKDHTKLHAQITAQYICLRKLSIKLIVVLGFYIPQTAKYIQRQDLGLKSHPKDWRSPGIELTTAGLRGK